tara:strand:+ start:740 stop:1333 length:594 start_codon:yes stop_codon:yes gene_type:complete
MNKISSIILAGLVLTLSGCVSHVEYSDPDAVETVNTDFGSTDLQSVTNKMVDSMLNFPPVVALTKQSRPIIFVSDIKNKTSEHIDTESITDSISSRLLRSGRFRFIDMTRVEQVRKQLDYQNNSGMVDTRKAIQFGHQVGAQYMLYGNLSSIIKQSGSDRNAYYKMTMRLMDLKTGLIEWSDEKEIRKIKERSLFGL